MIKKTPLKGMKDVLPNEAAIRRNMQNIIIESFSNNGFFEVSTPSLDSIELLQNNQGGDNEKIMFKVLKRGEKLDLSSNDVDNLVDMGLRFDLTLPLSRYYANNQNDLTSPFKCFQIGNVWRGERPQKGRFRQFTQCDVDILGDDSINAEISLIKTVGDTLFNLGFRNHVVKVNDRRLIDELISRHNLQANSTEVMIGLDKLDKINDEKLLEDFDNKGINVENAKNLLLEINELKNISISDLTSRFDNEYVNDLVTVLESFENNDKFVVEYDPNLIRGMGYYTGIVFEIKETSSDLNLSIAGGGRYDKLVGNIISMDVPACGFSIGFERIAMILLENKKMKISGGYAIIVPKLSSREYIMIMDEMEKLQSSGNKVSLVSKKKNLTKQIDDLKLSGFDKVCIYKDVVEFKDI